MNRSRKTRSTRRRPRFESLEGRKMFAVCGVGDIVAGDVTAEVRDGDLSIEGTDERDVIGLWHNSNGELILSRGASKCVEVFSAADVTGDVRISLHGGDDHVGVGASGDFPRDVVFDGGSGFDRLHSGKYKTDGASVGRDLRLVDVESIFADHLTVENEFSATSASSQTTHLRDSVIRNRLEVAIDYGTNRVLLEGSSVEDGNALITTTHGKNDVKIALDNHTFTGESEIRPRIAGDLTIVGCDQDSSVSINDAIIGGLHIENGSGYDTIVIADSEFENSVHVANNDGGSRIQVDRIVVGGGLTVRNGDGDWTYRYNWREFENEVLISDSKVDHLLRIENGDYGSLTKLTNVHAGLAQIVTGAHDDNVVMTNVIVASGSMYIGTGAGADRVTISDCDFQNRFDVQTGSGNDFLHLHAVTVGEETNIDTGDHDDQIHLYFCNLASSSIFAGAGKDSLFDWYTNSFQRAQVNGLESAVSFRFNVRLGYYTFVAWNPNLPYYVW